MGPRCWSGDSAATASTFNATAANAQSAMLLLALTALVMPAVYQLVVGGGLPAPDAERVDFGSTVEHLSLAVAIVLIISYVTGLVFSLKTHRSLFNPPYEEEASGWSVRRGVIALAIAGVLVGVMSEVLVGSICRGGRVDRPERVLHRRDRRGDRRATRPSTGSRCWSRPRTRWTSP